MENYVIINCSVNIVMYIIRNLQHITKKNNYKYQIRYNNSKLDFSSEFINEIYIFFNSISIIIIIFIRMFFINIFRYCYKYV